MRVPLLAALLACSALPATASDALPIGQPEVRREQVGSRTSENIPAIPPELVERLSRYQNTRGANLAGWLHDGSLLVTTRFGETNQVHRVAQPLGMREQLTFYPEPLSAVASAPARGGNGFVFGKDVGG